MHEYKLCFQHYACDFFSQWHFNIEYTKEHSFHLLDQSTKANILNTEKVSKQGAQKTNNFEHNQLKDVYEPEFMQIQETTHRYQQLILAKIVLSQSKG